MSIIVIKKEVQWGRTGYLKIENNQIIFDCSDEEYGPVFFPLELMKEKIKEYDSKKS